MSFPSWNSTVEIGKLGISPYEMEISISNIFNQRPKPGSQYYSNAGAGIGLHPQKSNSLLDVLLKSDDNTSSTL